MKRQPSPYDDIDDCEHVPYTNPISGYTKCKKCGMNLPDPYDPDTDEVEEKDEK